MKALDNASTVVASETQVSASLAGEAVILSLKDGVYYGLDPVGAAIWSLVQEPVTVAELCATILDCYDVERARCERDVLELLRKLNERGLLEVEDAGAR